MCGVQHPCLLGNYPCLMDTGIPMTPPSPYRERVVVLATLQSAVSFVTVTTLWLAARGSVGWPPPHCREGFRHGSASGPRACSPSHGPLLPGSTPGTFNLCASWRTRETALCGKAAPALRGTRRTAVRALVRRCGHVAAAVPARSDAHLRPLTTRWSLSTCPLSISM